jgi:hypothetical protein
MRNKLLILFAASSFFAVTGCKKIEPIKKQKDSTIVAVTDTVRPTFGWVVQIGGNDNSQGTAIRIDDNHNVFSYGNFRSTVDFDPGPAVFDLTAAPDIVSQGSYEYVSSLYMQELDTAGKFITANIPPTYYTKTIKGAGGVTFQWPVFDTIYKYNAAGKVIWLLAAKYATGYEEHFSGVTTDAAGNLFVAGYIYLNRTYDKYGGIVNFGTTTCYLKKIDVNGNTLWTNSTLNNPIDNLGTDGGGNVYGLAYYAGIIQRFDPSGTVLSTTPIQVGQQADNLHFRSVMAVDNAGNCYVTGFFTGTVDFDTGSKVYNLTSRDNNMFLEKIGASGNFKWAVQFINVEQYQYYSAGSFSSLALDNDNNIYLTGQFYGTVNFDPGSGTHTLTKTYAQYWDNEATDAFVLKLNQGH